MCSSPATAMATRPAANARAPSRVATDAIRLIGLINLSKLPGLRLHGLPERRIRSFPAPLDQPRNDTVCGIDVDDAVHNTAARVTGSRPVHHLRFDRVIDEQKVATRHLSTGLSGRA